MQNSIYFDEYDFCVPKFINGNIYNLNPLEERMRYDRIYVGAGVSDDSCEDIVKKLLKDNGIAIIPLNDSVK